MKVDEFDYDLASDSIAQYPLSRRDQSRLLVLRRDQKTMEEALFLDLPRLLEPGDLVVVNDTRVAPFRLTGHKATGGRAEITLTRRFDDHTWECLVRARNPRPGMSITLAGGMQAELTGISPTQVRVSAREGTPLWQVKLSAEDFEKILRKEGLPPLPPYVHRSAEDDPSLDRERYQTVYAREGEAAAAPTAGLHFTARLLEELSARGVDLARVRLDVNWGSFAPVRVERVEDHRMHPEWYHFPEETAEAMARARKRGGRVVAVGTTTVRVLEQVAGSKAAAGSGETSLFIYPGFSFRAVDAMVTNFHLPRSTLIMLVSAFAGRDFIRDAYQYALERGFRFLSYGDAMLIL